MLRTFARSTSTMANNNNMEAMLQAIRSKVPPLYGAGAGGAHKGQAGRVAVVGGSFEYTGGPYFAAISALKVGADLSHVFCTRHAAPVIKSYSPELIVHPLLDAGDGALAEIESWLERMHVVVVGPGLGRDPQVQRVAREIIRICKRTKKPLVLDADALLLVNEDAGLALRDYPPPGVVLTPNKIEFKRLYEAVGAPGTSPDDEHPHVDFSKLGPNVVVLRKGAVDRVFCADAALEWSNAAGGSPRRCGGQGDLLSGSLGAFFHWCSQGGGAEGVGAATRAAYAAALLTRRCNERAFREKGRSMLCTDMIGEIHDAFAELYEGR